MCSGRHLTSGETALCQHVFGGSVPATAVKIVARSDRILYGGFTPFGRINVSESAYVTDWLPGGLNGPADADDAHFFLHELAHVWQYCVGLRKARLYFKARREGRRLLRAKGKKVYSFNMTAAVYSYHVTDPDSDLLDFNLEQQCDIIADYFALTLWSKTPTNHWGYPAASEGELKSVLARFLADPSYPTQESAGQERRAERREKALVRQYGQS
jgi:hypothetical protein